MTEGVGEKGDASGQYMTEGVEREGRGLGEGRVEMLRRWDVRVVAEMPCSLGRRQVAGGMRREEENGNKG